MYKKFYVSKSDKNKLSFVKKLIKKINPSSIYVLCEPSRSFLFEELNVVVMPLKKLNETKQWIEFSNNFDSDSLLIIDNVIKFLNYGDGKKKYLRVISQSIDNVIVMDVVPFYTEPYEIFYPLFFLDKSILGYNNYNSFKANHLEEKQDGSIGKAHSFEVLRQKLNGFYLQDYDYFFNKRNIINWSMSNEEKVIYSNVVENMGASKEFSNPIRMMTKAADTVNLFQSKADRLKKLLKKLDGKIAVVINIISYEKRIRKMLDLKKEVTFKTFHDKDFSSFLEYDHVIYYDNIIVKPHKVFYIEPFLKGNVYLFLEETSKVDKILYDRVYGSKLRTQFNRYFSNV